MSQVLKALPFFYCQGFQVLACELATSRLLYIARACELATFLFLYIRLRDRQRAPVPGRRPKKRTRRSLSLTVSVSIIFDAKPHAGPLDHEKITPNTWNDRLSKLPVGHPIVVLHPLAMQRDSLCSINCHHFLLKPCRNFDTVDIRATLDPSVQMNTSALHTMAQTIRMHRTCIRLA